MFYNMSDSNWKHNIDVVSKIPFTRLFKVQQYIVEAFHLGSIMCGVLK